MTLLVVGAGLAGATLAHLIATNLNQDVLVIDRRSHVGGNCHTSVDAPTGITVHDYGPHIFHSPVESVYRWFSRFSELQPYEHHVFGRDFSGDLLPLPVNLETISRVAGSQLSPDAAKQWIESNRSKISAPKNFEEVILASVGAQLYERIYREYTFKQWGVDPSQLPASVARRLPVRFNLRRNYHHSNFVGIPKNGYTVAFEKLLDHPRITTELGRGFSRLEISSFSHVFFSGPIDEFFAYSEGALGYRTVWWEQERRLGDFQGTPQINLLSAEEAATRVIEHKHFEYWNDFPDTIVSREFSKETGIGDEPYYPKRLDIDKRTLLRYRSLAERSSSVTFMGRLGTYRYLDMWMVIDEIHRFFQRFLSGGIYGTEQLPSFVDETSI